MPKEDVLKFVFQPIELKNLLQILPAKKGKYTEITSSIIERIGTMPLGNSFLVSLADRNRRLSDSQVRGLVGFVNKKLRTDALPWHFVYLPKEKAFAVAPFARGKASRPAPVSFRKSSNDPAALEKLVEVTKKTFSVTLKALQVKGHKHLSNALMDIKRAFLYVGKNELGVPMVSMGKILDLTQGSMTPLYQSALQKAEPEIRKLSLALKEAE